MPPIEDLVTHEYANVDGVRLHYAAAGDGPLVVLLHGFPQFWYCWRHQIPALVEAGFRVVALDMRGYNLSDKPGGVSAYSAGLLAADVAGLIRSVGESTAAVVGHDWGAVVAWHVALRHPEVVRRLAILNGPHPARYQKIALNNPSQLAKSWYVFFFGIPWLPEMTIRALDASTFGKLMGWDRIKSISSEDVKIYKDALEQPGTLTSALNYYRAALRGATSASAGQAPPVMSPTLVIWGDRDPALVSAHADVEPELVPDARIEHLPRLGHWVAEEDPAAINALLTEFLAARR